MSEQLEPNKQTAMAFYDLMFNQCQPAEAMRQYVGDAYIQHTTRPWRMAKRRSSNTSSGWPSNIRGNESSSNASSLKGVTCSALPTGVAG